eukprot:gnl/TRDRNA2_/TRDRNA2_188992_c0_seq1.p1 gnl/TRDRNA2_/TRDRNA2_188992_c0~~gnl/TRDRNA2_/TRDRNA2_188992_c0_seq1.p1  ORF type:complete len:335 (-),score=60.42 gnl/TRDRNA2_/TRDRNA2_188992_c0_seq1:115-1119(-)
MLQSLLLGFLAEFGDKTFFLAVIFAAWCPVSSIRNSEGALAQQGLVLAGCASALGLHAAVVEAGWKQLALFDRGLCTVAVVALVTMAVKAIVELQHADGGAKASELHVSTSAAAAASNEKPATPIQRMRSPQSCQPMGGFVPGFKAYDPEAYQKPAYAVREPQAHASPFQSDLEGDSGVDAYNPFASELVSSYGSTSGSQSTTPAVVSRSKDDATSRHSMDNNALLAAFFIPMLTIFAVEGGDKSNWVVRDVAHSSTAGWGAVLGAMIASIVAVFMGFLLERQLADSRLLFGVAAGLTVLSIVSMSQVLLQFNGTSLGLSVMPVVLLQHLHLHQ